MSLKILHRSVHRSLLRGNISAALLWFAIWLFSATYARSQPRELKTPEQLSPAASGDVTPADAVLTKQIVRLIELGKRGYPWENLEGTKFTAQEVSAMAHYIRRNPNADSYQLLYALKVANPAEYEKLPKVTRAKVLGSAIERLGEFCDFGIMPHRKEQDAAAPKFAMKELVELGDDALPSLLPLLDNKSVAPLGGSSNATEATLSHYRRCDYACWACALILSDQFSLGRDLRERDTEIQETKEKVKKRVETNTVDAEGRLKR